MPKIVLLPHGIELHTAPGSKLRDVLTAAGVPFDFPCGGQGTCGKCKVLLNGVSVSACRTVITDDCTVTLPAAPPISPAAKKHRGGNMAVDIGTTTVVCYLLDEKTGEVLGSADARNPQSAFGADVVSRVRAAAENGAVMRRQIVACMTELASSLCDDLSRIERIAVVGNCAMMQLFLGVGVDNLITPPYPRRLCDARVCHARDHLPAFPRAELFTAPAIGGYVGADTVACILGLPETAETVLLADIGTNGEIVLNADGQMTACATAAGPALEGVHISCGMRAEAGAICRVTVKDGKLCPEVLGGGKAKGICGSGLVDAVSSLLELGMIDRRGRLKDTAVLADGVFLTQQDIREFQLAKGAIRAGIELLLREADKTPEDVDRILLAGAFGSHLSPESACRTGLLPENCARKVIPIGNAAGTGACLIAAEPQNLTRCEKIAEQVHYTDLAALPGFPRCFAKAMEFGVDET